MVVTDQFSTGFGDAARLRLAPDPAADAIAGFEYRDDAAVRQRIPRHQPGQPSTDDRHTGPPLSGQSSKRGNLSFFGDDLREVDSVEFVPHQAPTLIARDLLAVSTVQAGIN